MCHRGVSRPLRNREWQDWQLSLVAVFDGIWAGSNARCPPVPPNAATLAAPPPFLAAPSGSCGLHRTRLHGLQQQQSDAEWQPRWSCAVNTTLCFMIYPGQAPTVTSPGMMLADIGGVSTGQGTGGYPQTGAGGHLGLDKTVSAAPS